MTSKRRTFPAFVRNMPKMWSNLRGQSPSYDHRLQLGPQRWTGRACGRETSTCTRSVQQELVTGYAVKMLTATLAAT